MQVWRELSDVPADFGPSVVTIGNFDGVHRGHVSVLRRMCTDAAAVGARAVAVTFSPHPQQVHRPETAPPLLTGDVDRLELLEQTGLDAVLLLEYSLEFARQTPEEFVRRYLVDGLRARTVVVGRDVRFGWNNSGDLSTMVELGREHGFDVEVIDDVTPAASADPGSAEDRAADPLRRRWSSTWVRELLDAGDVVQAARVLGRPHRVRGTVVHGDARGRELGFPTANLGPDATGMVPADGVYAGWLRRTSAAADDPDRVLPAAISIGTNPTFDGVERRVEAYVLDRTDLDLYGQVVVLELVERLRPTLRFDSIDDLVERMHEDVERTREVLRG
ncbi:bifunctional riboflavin kinase/FAD synthetase [Cellulomonas fengjieae]|uniref:Riboflavin biosynthesis protein n=1 Tax=Cellulomonas fengjieae TaxID=2819978 RepID=A0ABS3SF75_9CELL|nr:bifunctional riboflavin kinase/FAD synthetase [Cellulomonas fengjieae]MBO3084403.1 bifunctional riboflavin kinase/FAD synthetase [Cellulomonas fengjieae]MBO3103175.1 bifunctional riboflavin kinase/FAD synthetase [Cellulomonas fengjieae]QVI67250.1 bifunctional riboflavin kinase/FAD synthetase [Cellulomonas fengjieae]